MFGFLVRKKLPIRTLDEIKQIANILFIDDHKFQVVNILKNAGWNNTRQIKDIESLDQNELLNAHILFVDIQGVGKKLKFQDEGLGLISALRDKYPTKKIIVYSAIHEGDRFHEGLSKADARLRKNADPYEFQSLVEEFSRESFGLDECIKRIQELLRKELGQIVDTTVVIKALRKIQKKKNYEPSYIAKLFNLQNAGALASIIQLYITAGK